MNPEEQRRVIDRVRELQEELDAMGVGRQRPTIKYHELRVVMAEVSQDIRRWRHDTVGRPIPYEIIDNWADRLEAKLDE